MSELAIGIEEIDRKYEILERMGAGGMGEIFKARHRLLDEVRVIKTIQPQHREHEDLRARFLREAKVATQLRHPGIAALYDFSIGDNGTACIVMEFIKGRDLAKILRANEVLTQADILAIARQFLEALAYLHGKKIIHRDISPDNIMLAEGEPGAPVVKLIDLGIAKPLEGSSWQTRTNTFVGKLKYASPEQLAGGEEGTIDERSDLYSFGVVLYQLLTRQYPITGTDEASIMAGHLFREPKSFEETDPDGLVSPALREVLLKALAKEPDDRFASADELLRTLEAAADGIRLDPLDVTAPLTRTPARGAEPADSPTRTAAVTRPRVEAPAPRPPAGRKRWRLAALAAGAVLVLGLGGWLAVENGLVPTSLERSALQGIDFGHYHALVIGNANYEKLPPLETAVSDARELAALLEHKYGFEVTLLTDATRYDMITALTETAESMERGDNFLVYYAGHGYLDSLNQTGYWQPVDADPFNTSNWISTKHEVSATLGRIAAQHVLVVADSCYSGTLGDPLADQGQFEPVPEDLRGIARIRELLGRRSRVALTSGGLSPVLDQGDGSHSVFARALLDALGANDGVLESGNLLESLGPRVTEAARRFGAEQTPQIAPIARAGDEGGAFFFVAGTG